MDDVVERCRIAYENIIGINHLFHGEHSPVFALSAFLGLPALLVVIVFMFFLEQRSWRGVLISLVTVLLAVFFYFGYAVEMFAPITDQWWWSGGTVLFAATQTMGLALIIYIPILLIRVLVRPASFQPGSWWGRLMVYLVVGAGLVAWRIAYDAVPEIAAGPHGIDTTWVEQVLGTWPVAWPVDVAWWCAEQVTHLPVLIGLALLAVAGIVLRPGAKAGPAAGADGAAQVGAGTGADAGRAAGADAAVDAGTDTMPSGPGSGDPGSGEPGSGDSASGLDGWVQVGDGAGVGPGPHEHPVAAPADDGGTVGGYVHDSAADGKPGVVAALRRWRTTRSGIVIGTILTYLTSLVLAAVCSVGIVVVFAYYMPYVIGVCLVVTLVVLVVRRQRA